MKTHLLNIDFNDRNIRVIGIDGDAWFVASDVCHVVDIKFEKGIGSWTQDIRDDETRLVSRKGHPRDCEGPRGRRDLVLISESGLYKLILRSDMLEVRSFPNWVTRMVLPAIQEAGETTALEEKILNTKMSEDEAKLGVARVLELRIAREKNATQQREFNKRSSTYG
ncbi:BRO-N domain-containing protein [Sulfitobacter pontiacus]|uniref:BRO-N domain-containing protein n=1 Tax=Sulfitobacter pontiacus TaxID=60137 RepID=UPI0015DDFDF3|nr:BRO family protein [Sulfitobacter pontiacus]QLL42822.1 BRO domain-containing protein [Sulfitobacter pontiacus]